jgi:APA family basic amino acid/polyamine antiporter
VHAELRRELGFWDILAFMVGITIGAAIFAVPGRVATYFPSFAVIGLVWVLAALFALMGSLLYAELGARLPHTGGEYVYIHRAFGPLPAFLYGWSQLLVVRTNPVAALPLVCVEYASSLYPMSENTRLLAAAGIIVLLGTANYLGLRPGKSVQALTSIVKAGGMAVFVVAAIFTLREWTPNLAAVHQPTQPNWPSALLLVVFAYVGWDRVGYLAGEMRHPERDLPRAVAAGAVVSALLYLAMNVCYYAAIPIGTLAGSRTPASDVAGYLWGPTGRVLLPILVMFSTLGSTNANIMASPRVYYSMARDGLFFSTLARVHPRWKSPHVAILLHCGWALVLLAASRTVETMVGSFVFVALIFYGTSTLALFRFRRQSPAAPYLSPGYPWTHGLYLAAVAALVVATCYFSTRSAVANLLLMATALPFYYFWRKRTLS